MRGWIAVLALVACHHEGVDADRATEWLRDRGSATPTWEPCLRLGVAMRQACGSDAACAHAVTPTFTYWCYVAHYRSAKATGDDALSTSPCLWRAVNRHGDRYTQEGEPGFVTFDAWAAGLCTRFALPAAACSSELHDVEASCNIDLTGAGP